MSFGTSSGTTRPQESPPRFVPCQSFNEPFARREGRLYADQKLTGRAVQAAVSGMLPGPFAYAERWDEKSGIYVGLVIECAMNVVVVIDSDSVIVKPDVAETHRPRSIS